MGTISHVLLQVLIKSQYHCVYIQYSYIPIPERKLLIEIHVIKHSF